MNTENFKCPVCGSDSCSCFDVGGGSDDYKSKVNSIFRGRQKFVRNSSFDEKFKIKFKYV